MIASGIVGIIFGEFVQLVRSGIAHPDNVVGLNLDGLLLWLCIGVFVAGAFRKHL